MSTDTNTPEAKYTLISYRPNGERYEGCGDYTRFDSELELAANLSRDELRETIKRKIAGAADCCDSCEHNDNELEFAILKDGRPMAAQGSNLASFYPEEETEETKDTEAIFSEAREQFEKERAEKAEIERKAKEAAALKAQEAARAMAEAARVAAEARERAEFERLKTKFTPGATT